MDDLDRVLAGQCIHGHEIQRRCGTCMMTLYLADRLRHLLAALFRDDHDG